MWNRYEYAATRLGAFYPKFGEFRDVVIPWSYVLDYEWFDDNTLVWC